ncbi:hypothetical protein LWI28_001719 [Acer negundo]|uniref:PGG domain-containing protein n=1 Tax=Acer negundo TaxID=4023 RepID=A0AAD5JHV6_ACENE|nr:hypothetical protein LWI28_001719 [Acer negundo]
MEPIATGAAADPEAPPHAIQLPEIDESAYSSQGPRDQDNPPIYNWPILDLLPSKNSDWEKAKRLIVEDPSMVRTAITDEYETALHVATKAEQTGFALRIMEHMNEQDLTLQGLKGDTAFCLAVATGNIPLVEVMQSRKLDLATLRGSWNMTPLYLAVLLGKEDMAGYLYYHTVDLTPEERVRIFFQSIKTDLYVEKIIPVSLREAKNAEDLTARELFTIEHSHLVKSGSEWLRNSAGSCMLVATLIATVVFAAAFTVPGGNDDKTGIPLLQKNIWFRVFTISDAIAMSSSSFSILIILSILTSRYRETDFFISGTIKMIIALLTLFISVAAMSIAFGSTFFLVYHDGSNIIPVFALTVVTLPITVFVLLQYPLLKDMFYLTYYSSSLR